MFFAAKSREMNDVFDIGYEQTVEALSPLAVVPKQDEEDYEVTITKELPDNEKEYLALLVTAGAKVDAGRIARCFANILKRYNGDPEMSEAARKYLLELSSTHDTKSNGRH